MICWLTLRWKCGLIMYHTMRNYCAVAIKVEWNMATPYVFTITVFSVETMHQSKFHQGTSSSQYSSRNCVMRVHRCGYTYLIAAWHSVLIAFFMKILCQLEFYEGTFSSQCSSVTCGGVHRCQYVDIFVCANVCGLHVIWQSILCNLYQNSVWFCKNSDA